MRVICRAAAERPTGAQKAAAKAKPLANGLMQKKPSEQRARKHKKPKVIAKTKIGRAHV